MRTEPTSALEAAISELPLLDHHCHGVRLDTLPELEFRGLMSEGGVEVAGDFDVFLTPLGLGIRALCAGVLGLAPHSSADDYLESRLALAPAQAAEAFLRASPLAGLLVDTGHLGDSVADVDQMGALADRPAREIVRIEAVAEQVRKESAPEDFPDAFIAALASESEGAAGLKSIVAYRVGLDLDPTRPTEREVVGQVRGWSAGGRLEDETVLRYCLGVGFDLAAERGLPVQIHVGFGDRDLDLWRVDPTRFTPWLRVIDPSVSVCLLHCWPFHREAAFLSTVWPNVYFDTGLLNTHGATNYRQILNEALDITPFEKVLYSSDAFGLPELYHVGSIRFRQALSEILQGWVGDDRCDVDTALEVAELIGSRNAARVYGP